MTTLPIQSAVRNAQPRNRAPIRRVVRAFGLAWYGALLVAALMPAPASASPAAQASVKETAQTHRVPGTETKSVRSTVINRHLEVCSQTSS